MVAPIFCLLYAEIFQQRADDSLWLLGDMESLAFLVLLYPVVEELTFRGIIQEFFQGFFGHRVGQRRAIMGVSVANLLTSLLFVVMHFVHHAPTWALLTFVPSLIFGYFKERHATVVSSIVLHMFYNFCFLSLVGQQ